MAEESISEPITPEIVIIPDEVRSRSSEEKLIASKSGTTTLLNPRRASTGSFGNRGRKFSSGRSSPLSGGESSVPHYLRASTGSRHDFCKYGNKQETEVKPWQNRAKKVITLISNQQNRLETGDSSEKKIANAFKSKPPVSRTISRNKSTVSEKVSSSAKESKDAAVNEKKNIVLEKRNSLDLSGKKENEIKPVKTKGTPKELTRRKLVSSPVAYLATKPSFNRDLGLKFIANRSNKLLSSPKDQNKFAKPENKRATNVTGKEKTLHVTNLEPKKTVIESKEKKHKGIKEVENELVESEKVTDEILSEKIVSELKQKESIFYPSPSEVSTSPTVSFPIKSSELSYGEEEATDALEYNTVEKKVSIQKENTIDILPPSESFSSLNFSSPAKSQTSSFGEDEAQDELEISTYSEKKVSESENNESNNDLLSSESVSSPNISSPARTPAFTFAEEEAQDELEYFDREIDGSDESISERSETRNSDDEETSVGHYNNETRKAKGSVSEGKDKATKLKFKRGKVVEIESNNSGPRRLRFRRARHLDDIEDNDVNNRKRSFTNKRDSDGINSINDDSKKVVLRHQQVEGKKDAQGLFNNVIEETASKLVETRKSKVKALVGAFETVISLQESNPSTPTAP